MKTQIMLDIETLGTRPGSVITSIGAVKFGGGEITSDFYICMVSTTDKLFSNNPNQRQH